MRCAFQIVEPSNSCRLVLSIPHLFDDATGAFGIVEEIITGNTGAHMAKAVCDFAYRHQVLPASVEFAALPLAPHRQLAH